MESSSSATEGHVIESLMEGTFHRAEGPGAPPLVEIGSRVSEGTALCIIEAMKLMNELVSDIDGTVVEILAEEGQEVEYGQPLMILRP